MTVKLNNYIQIFKRFTLFIFLFCSFINTVNAQKSAGIGTDKPDPKAVLELNVENPVTNPQGLLLPRLTDVQGTLLGSMLNTSHKGMSAYNTTNNTFYIWDGTQWKSTGSVLTSIVGIGGITVSTLGSNFTIDGSNLVTQWISASSNQIYTNSFVGIGTSTPTSPFSVSDLFSGNGRISAKYNITHTAPTGFNKAIQLNYSFAGTGATEQFAGIETNISGNQSSVSSNTPAFIANNNITGLGNSTGYRADIGGSNSGTKAGFDARITGTGGTVNLGYNAIISGASAKNIGINVNVSGGTTNYAALFNGGNVGIGSLAPTAKLMVTDGSRDVFIHAQTANNYEDLINIFNNNVGESAGIQILSQGNAAWNIYTNNDSEFLIGVVSNSLEGIKIKTSSNGADVTIGENIYNVGISTTTIASANFVVSALSGGAVGSVVTVNGAGKLGIGTLSIVPSQWTTTTNGIFYNGGGGNVVTSYNQFIVNSASNAQMAIENPSTALNAVSEFALISNAGGGPGQYFVMGVNKGGRNFYIFPQGYSGGDALNMDFSGNVGIGVASGSTISAKLEVNGNTRIAQNLTVSGLSGASGSIVTVDGAGKLGIGGQVASSQWLTTAAGIYYSTSVGVGMLPIAGNTLNVKSSGNSTKPIRVEYSGTAFPIFEVDQGSGGQGNLMLYDNAGVKVFQVGVATPTYFIGSANFGIGTITPNEKLTVQGNTSATGISYFGTLVGNNMSGAPAGSVVTVDGTGRLGFGGQLTTSQWLTTAAGIYYGTSVGIGMLPYPNQPLALKSTSNGSTILGLVGATTTSNIVAFVEEAGNGVIRLSNNAGISRTQLTPFGNTYFLDNIGVGIQNPSNTPYRLLVKGNTSISGGTLAVESLTSGGVNLVSALADGTLTVTGQTITSSQWSNTTSGILYNSGNVAIGTSVNPTQGKLVVVEDAVNNPGIFVSGGGGTKSVNIQLGRTTSPDGGIGIAGAIGSFSGVAGLGDMVVRSESNNLILSSRGVGKDIIFTTGTPDTEKMRITNSGNVGIGVTPVSKLELKDSDVSNGSYESIKFDISQSASSNITKQGLLLNYSVSGTASSIFRGMTTNVFGSSSSSNSVNGNTVTMNVAGFANISGFVASIPSNSSGTKIGAFVQVNGTGGPRNIGLDVNVSGATTNYAALFNGGNVGIGTTAPSQNLVVVGNQSTTGIGYFGTLIGNNLIGPAGSVVTVDGVGRLGLGTLSNSSQWATTTNGIYYNTGNVGIGTGSPLDLLHVKSTNASENDYISISSIDNARFVSLTAGRTLEPNSGLFFSSGNDFRIGSTDNLNDFDESTATEFLRIKASGDVGIGTTNPNQRLVVVGNTSITGVGYFGTLIGNNLSGAAGSIVTVDGVGRLGLGTIVQGNNYWEANGVNKIYTNSFVGIGESNPTTPLNIKSTDSNLPSVLKITRDATGGIGSQVGIDVAFTGSQVSGSKIGYNVKVTNPAGENVRGMSSEIEQNNTTAIGVLNASYSYINNNGPAQSWAFRAENGGTGTNNHIGFSAFDNSSGNSGERFGLYAEMTGTGATSNNYAIFGRALGAGLNNYAGYFADGKVYIENNLGIGTTSPTAKLDVNGTLRFRNFTNGILTVDGTGLVGVGALPTATNWKSTTVGVTFTDDKIAIGTSTVAGAAKFKVAGDGSMGGMVITSQSLVNPLSTSNTIYTTLITVPVYIPQGTNTVEFNVIGSSQGGGNIDFQLDVSGNTSSPISMINTTPTIGAVPQIVNVASLNGWQTLKINVANSAGNTSAILHGYTVIVKN